MIYAYSKDISMPSTNEGQLRSISVAPLLSGTLTPAEKAFLRSSNQGPNKPMQQPNKQRIQDQVTGYLAKKWGSHYRPVSSEIVVLKSHCGLQCNPRISKHAHHPSKTRQICVPSKKGVTPAESLLQGTTRYTHIPYIHICIIKNIYRYSMYCSKNCMINNMLDVTCASAFMLLPENRQNKSLAWLSIPVCILLGSN